MVCWNYCWQVGFFIYRFVNSLILISRKGIFTFWMAPDCQHFLSFKLAHFSFEIMTDLILWRLKTLDLTVSTWCGTTFLFSWHTSWKLIYLMLLLGLCSGFFMLLSKLFALSKCEDLLLYAWHVQGPAVFTVYASLSSGWFCSVKCFVLLFLLFMTLNSLLSFVASMSTFFLKCTDFSYIFCHYFIIA